MISQNQKLIDVMIAVKKFDGDLFGDIVPRSKSEVYDVCSNLALIRYLESLRIIDNAIFLMDGTFEQINQWLDVLLTMSKNEVSILMAQFNTYSVSDNQKKYLKDRFCVEIDYYSALSIDKCIFAYNQVLTIDQKIDLFKRTSAADIYAGSHWPVRFLCDSHPEYKYNRFLKIISDNPQFKNELSVVLACGNINHISQVVIETDETIILNYIRDLKFKRDSLNQKARKYIISCCKTPKQRIELLRGDSIFSKDRLLKAVKSANKDIYESVVLCNDCDEDVLFALLEDKRCGHYFNVRNNIINHQNVTKNVLAILLIDPSQRIRDYAKQKLQEIEQGELDSEMD